MRLLDVALKDMRQSYRSLSAIMFMFVVPILVTGLFYFMFGGTGDGDGGFALPRTTLLVVNLDEGQLPVAAQFGGNAPVGGSDEGAPESMGELMVEILLGEPLADLFDASESFDPDEARLMVDDQLADVAIIIPANLTDAVMLPDQTAELELYKDPTLILGPAIVESVLEQLANGFSTAKIGTSVAIEQLAEQDVPITSELVEGLISQFAELGITQAESSPARVNIRSTAGAAEEVDLRAQVAGQIMGAMMTFFAFFTGATMMQTILVEEEKGTLARLFTTPTSVATILGGKVVSAILTVLVQLSVLIFFGRIVFGISWGAPLPLALAASGIVVISAATGIFLVSWLKNTRQSGTVYGGVLTLTGMIGMIGSFSGVEATPTIQTVSLLVPQGWASRGVQIVMHNGSALELLPTLAGLLVWAFVFAIVGQYRLQRRFA